MNEREIQLVQYVRKPPPVGIWYLRCWICYFSLNMVHLNQSVSHINLFVLFASCLPCSIWPLNLLT